MTSSAVRCGSSAGGAGVLTGFLLYWGERLWLGVHVAAAAQQGRQAGDYREGGGYREHHDEPVMERTGDELRKEHPAGQDLLADGGQGGEHAIRRQQVL